MSLSNSDNNTSNATTIDNCKAYSRAPSSLLLLSSAEDAASDADDGVETQQDVFQSHADVTVNHTYVATLDKPVEVLASNEVARNRSQQRARQQTPCIQRTSGAGRRSAGAAVSSSHRQPQVHLANIVNHPLAEDSQVHRSASDNSISDQHRLGKRHKCTGATNGEPLHSTQDKDADEPSEYNSLFDGLSHERRSMEYQINRLDQQQQRTVTRIESLLRKHLTTYILMVYEPDMFVPAFVSKPPAEATGVSQTLHEVQPEPLLEVQDAVVTHIKFLLGAFNNCNVSHSKKIEQRSFTQMNDEEFRHYAKRVLATLNDIIPGVRCVRLAQRTVGQRVSELTPQVDEQT